MARNCSPYFQSETRATGIRSIVAFRSAPLPAEERRRIPATGVTVNLGAGAACAWLASTLFGGNGIVQKKVGFRG